jgi:hypothetical protein
VRRHKLKAYIVVTVESECAAAVVLYNCYSYSSLEVLDFSCFDFIKFTIPTAAFNAIFSALVMLLTVRITGDKCSH